MDKVKAFIMANKVKAVSLLVVVGLVCFYMFCK